MKITDKAKSYISQHGGLITIEFNGIGGCCVPIYIALAELREPEEPERYQRIYLDGITVYYPNGAIIKEDDFLIDLITSGSVSRLEVAGIYYGDHDHVQSLK